MSIAEKSFDPLDRTLTLVDAKDDLDPYSFEDGVLKARLSCGHVVSAESLTDSCRVQLDEGNYKFKCSAFVDGRLCNQPLSYREVRKLADLTVEEMQYFEENIAGLAAADYSDVQMCPKCRTNIERMDMSNLCVECSVCSADQEESYLFCWQCLKPWTGPAPRSDRCANSDCRNYELQLLQTCTLTDLPQVRGVNAVPSIRACPTCTEEEEEENNKTEETSAKDKPVRHSLKIGAMSDPEVQHPGVHESNDKTRQSKRVKDKMNKKHEPSQDVRDRRFQENVGYKSAFRNRPDEVIIKKPVKTEETSERIKQLRQDFDKRVKWRAGFAKNARRSRLPLSNIQWQQSTQAGYQSGQASPVKNTGEQRHVSQHLDLGLGESKQNDVQIHPAANRRDAVQGSSSSKHENGIRHHYMSGPEHRMRSEERSVPSGEWNQGRPGSERFGHIMPKESHSFHGQHQKYRSQDYHLERFGREMERNDERTEKERRGTQNYNYKEKAGLQSQREAVHGQPSVEKPQLHRTPQQCLDTAEQKKMRSSQWSSRESLQSGRLQRPRSGHDDGRTTGRVIDAPDHKSKAKKSTNYSPPNERSFRNQPYGNTKPEEEIMPDSLDEVNNLTPKSTRKGQTLNQVRGEIVLDTNDSKTKKNETRSWMTWFSVIPFKMEHPK